MHVVICGGGVIGACTAYFLSRRGIDVTVVERTEIAAAASGKAGGFLALDWCAGTPLDALARRSFQLHAALPKEIGADWSYRRMNAYSGVVVGERSARRHEPAELDWLADGVIIALAARHDGNDRDRPAAHLHHGHDDGRAGLGAKLRPGRVTGLVARCRWIGRARRRSRRRRSSRRTRSSSRWDPGRCWRRSGWPCPPCTGCKVRASSTTPARTSRPTRSFSNITTTDGEAVSVELFPRGDGTTHITAFSDQAPLPIDPAAVTPDPRAIERLQAIAERLSPAFRAERIVARQSCFRPVTQDGLPLIGPVPGVAGAYIATGHSVWGILNAPATGEALAELIADGAARSTDLTPFDPARLRALDPSLLRST